jgi:hypothetical protein
MPHFLRFIFSVHSLLSKRSPHIDDTDEGSLTIF